MAAGHQFAIGLRADTQLRQDRTSLSVCLHGQPVLRLDRPSLGVAAAVSAMAAGGDTERALTAVVRERDGLDGLARFYYVLGRLAKLNLCAWSVRGTRGRLATLTSMSPGHRPRAVEPDPATSYVLSRFAFTRRHERGHVLESSRTPVRMLLHDHRGALVVHAAATPGDPKDIAARCIDVAAEEVHTLLAALVGSDLLVPAAAEGTVDTAGTAGTVSTADAVCTAEDEDPALAMWEFHDLLFHTRSRNGRHDQPVGGTYPHLGRWPAPPALAARPEPGDPGSGGAEPGDADASVPLVVPDLEALSHKDPPYVRVQEDRRSVRRYGPTPLRLDQLGEFLYRVGRVREQHRVDIPGPEGPSPLAVATRPYPNGGALYELDLYVVAATCEGLPGGLYRYDGAGHRLLPVSGDADPAPLLDYAARSIHGRVEDLHVLVTIAARFGRMTWKYQSVAYSLILKDVGVLMQTMYLAATAMGLAPCALGGGDADLFARVAGVDYFTETSVGEFLLGGSPAPVQKLLTPP
ncbi:SagB family peptide dehydrogenase [Actinopolymorpha rutila]|uniref:SagB-type dehydrogenase family enzyme n=1 Tax=Actinopolymorpha rutila TaxID=446787 RepID=A0A852ZAR4_9ACTN|nr:SagB-type dehydrogenase family enzyme [Actinopolymorpha rutila]